MGDAGSRLGAWLEPGGARWRVWAPERRAVELQLEGPAHVGARPLEREPAGYFGVFVPGAAAGQRYRYRLDGDGPFPDPASRFQPEGVHGPSEVIDPRRFVWTDAHWRGVAPADLVIYELHVGTFTAAGTFAGAAERLPYLRDLGVTAVELMPVADFPGARNWGYDGVALFAPARCYGRPDDLRHLVDRAHALGLAVLLDVVYNHFGPDGAYHGCFSRRYYDRRRHTPWGAALRFEGRAGAHVREFFFENAAHWVREYHVDGLRLDATHELRERGPRFFLAELRERLQAAFPARPPLLVAEDPRNLASMLKPPHAGGWGLDGVWADDFHHALRRALTADRRGSLRDFSGAAGEVATSVRQGWLFTGQRSRHLHGPRGSEPAGIEPRRFVVCLQNHDQVGNRAHGERLHAQLDAAAWRAVSALLLLVPETPLLFMGQEWAASTPFQFFSDHHAELGRRVRAGRRRELRRDGAIAKRRPVASVPDPQALATFTRSRLDWDEPEQLGPARVLALYRALLRLRRRESALVAPTWEAFEAVACEPAGMLLGRRSALGRDYVVAVQWRGAAELDTHVLAATLADTREAGWRVLLSTEDAAFCDDPRPPWLDLAAAAPVVRFGRPGAIVLARG